jgi:hypothetical protein
VIEASIITEIISDNTKEVVIMIEQKEADIIRKNMAAV